MSDPLAAFRAWEGQELGPTADLEPGWHGTFKPPATALHIAGAHTNSTARRDRHGDLHPAVWLRVVAGALGTGPDYHILEAILDADVALELAQALEGAALRSPLDIAQGRYDP